MLKIIEKLAIRLMYILKSAEHIDLNSEDIIEAGVFPNLVILEDRVGLCIEC